MKARQPLRDKASKAGQGSRQESSSSAATTGKRKREAGKAKGDDDEDEDSDTGDICLEGNLYSTTDDVTFEFQDTSVDHVEGLTVLLKTLINNPTRSYEVANAICENVAVGTVITCEGATDTFALVTVINPNNDTIHSSPIGKIFDEFASSSDLSVDTNRLGLMLYRKFSNLPLDLIVPLHQSLKDDLSWARDDAKQEEIVDKEFYSGLTHIVLLCPVTAKGFSVEAKKGLDATGSPSIQFEYFEDEIYHQRASQTILFKSTLVDGLMAGIVIPVGKLQNYVNDISQLLSRSK